MIVLSLDLRLYLNILIIVFWLKIFWRGLDLGKCKSISERKHLLNCSCPIRQLKDPKLSCLDAILCCPRDKWAAVNVDPCLTISI